MTVIANAGLVLKDSQGNKGIVKSFTDNDIDKISSAITDVGQVVDPATHMPIEATKTSAGVVQLATAQDITNGTAGKVVDAQELNNFAQTLPAANGVTDVSSGDNSNQLVVSRIGGSKTLTIDNVEHAGTATSADSVAWDNVSGKPSTFTPSSHNHDSNYLKLSGGNITGSLTVQNKNVDAIEEQGDEYIRYSSGIQICWGQFGGLTTNYKTISFQKPFLNNNTFGFSVMGQNASKVISLIGWENTQFYVKISSNELDAQFKWLAIGRWK